ncbi:hypothetical protein SCUCBS95973_003083 [Sporothrix curviconia]|uniref:Amidase n=1 Tax=Sporothrix curviconia TaxID=1260050 RepID=A0ABP0BCC0_9PEZI
MTRNVRRKAPPSKAKRRRGSDVSSSIDLSSDGGYSALDDVSDSEDDDEEDVAAAEEKHIIQGATKARHAPSPRPAVQNEEEDADEEEDEDAGSSDDDDDEDDLELDDADFPEFALEDLINQQNNGGGNDNDNGGDDTVLGNGRFADDGASWNGISESDANQNGASAPKRQVRFADLPDSDSDSTSSDVSVHQFFPDIFVEQGSLDPGFRREIENDSDSSVSSSFWDYSSGYGLDSDAILAQLSDADLLGTDLPGLNNDILPSVAEEDAAGAEDEELEEEGLDGYQTDGDTTEEDEPQLIPIRRKLARRIQLIDSDEESSESESEVEMALDSRHGQPRAKRYLLTPRSKRPVAFIHPHTGKMVIFTPEKPPQAPMNSMSMNSMNSNSMDSMNSMNSLNSLNSLNSNAVDVMSDPIFDTSNILLPPDNGISQSSPLMNNASSVMMGAMFSSNTFGDYMHAQNIGPIEAFFPTLSSDAFLGEDSDFSGEFFEDDGESNLRIEDFIQFDRNTAEDAVDPADQLFDMSVPPPMPSDDLFLDLDTAGLPDNDDLLTPLAGTPMGPPASTRRSSFAASSSICADDEQDDEDDEADNNVPPLLAHFGKNSDAVGAFRRNQINQQLIYSNKATAESLAFSGPYTMGTLRGIKNGSFGAVATPITPPRRPKQRQSMSSLGAAKDFRTQNNQDSAPQKRKASNAVSDALHHHKRPRSISELNNIFL